MTREASTKHKRPAELRIALDSIDYEDICALAKVSGLAASQYARAVLKNHLAKVYAPKDETL